MLTQLFVLSAGTVLRMRSWFAPFATAAKDGASLVLVMPAQTKSLGQRGEVGSGWELLSTMIIHTEAQLFVADIKAACDFYTEKLGFTVAFVYGDPPFYGQVVRDHARLNLRVVGEPVFVGDVRERERLLSATLTVATAGEIKQLFLSYQAAGVRFIQALKKEPWGAKTFIVVDPDGNLILFTGPAD